MRSTIILTQINSNNWSPVFELDSFEHALKGFMGYQADCNGHLTRT